MRKRKWKKISLNLNKKLALFALVIIVPMVILILYLILSLINFGNAYNQIVKNITAANAYNINFKEEIDYSMYRIVIGSADFETAKESTEIRDPYEIIEEARNVFKKLYEISITPGNKGRIEKLLKNLDTLQDRVDDIKYNLSQKGKYEDNIYLLDTSIYILSEIIQEHIQMYIYYEASNFETIRNELAMQQANAVRISLFAFVIILLGSILISMFIVKSVTKPIKQLCDTTDIVARGDFTTRAYVESDDEISVLTNSFNNMIQKIGDLVEDIKKEQHNLRVMELKLLQAQINPHFLYNTLDTIIWLAEGNQTTQVVNMVTSLSDFFRTVLSEGRDYITIKEEESYIRSYLEIQKFRYQDILEYEINIDAAIHHYTILKLTLQPLVENALYHGIKNKRGKGKICVIGKLINDMIYLEVNDNGKGMTKEELSFVIKRVKGHKEEDLQGGFGLANVDERIRLNYGLEYGLEFESVEGEGTKVWICLPIHTIKT
ncbi:sensor histidine kinase [Candidatus Galacturonibacter soehngenii]|uniref:Sensor histidine kinase n=1 Tax=Candidatus Galacturonatibacter soehngenii TaxID=2307010 RepID=A0A7V7UDN0_9FIRM|nr:sensor histidine kinase [Candidatus Galacturonibacter soehngenii]KAB1440732.1 sensor histidine kinase [Candidatus Galacturonibacter soehngenii]MBA4687494.1 sensor histidine kinase [Candidatus Galacturonibacter soehngenii]